MGWRKPEAWCPFCGVKFTGQAAVDLHIERDHQNKPRPADPRDEQGRRKREE